MTWPGEWRHLPTATSSPTDSAAEWPELAAASRIQFSCSCLWHVRTRLTCALVNISERRLASSLVSDDPFVRRASPGLPCRHVAPIAPRANNVTEVLSHALDRLR